MAIFERIRSVFSSPKVDLESRFELMREAISGTMASFFMARDRKTGDIVGLKVCDSEKVDAFENRFRGLKKPTEGEIAMSLKHPRIVETMEHGTTTEQAQFIVMEFLDGPGLHSLIRSNSSLLDGKRLELVRQMADAIGHVHHCEYIHRDVCPRNFICSADATSLKLIDFGLTLPAEREYKQPGNRTGTAMYMAPEIVKRRWTDHRVDIFAFGATAYHLCAGDLPWRTAENPAMTAMAHETVAPTDILELNPRLNPELAAAIMQCLEVDPAKRPQSTTDFLRLIEGVRTEHVD